MWMIIIPLACGYILSAWKPGLVARLPVAGITNVSLILLLVVMGARIGADSQVISQIARIGLQAFVLAWAAVLGSILLLILLQFLLPGTRGASSSGVPGPGASGHRLTLMLLGSVLGGTALGLLIIPETVLPVLNSLTTWVLGLLLLGIGFDLGGSTRAFAQLRYLGWRIILVPAAVVMGSIAGAVVVVLLWRVTSWHEAAAVASGFGWYSLSSVMIAQMHSPLLGAVAFIANVFRELIAIIITPLVARRLGPVPSLGAAGATAMDVLLPVIAKGTGRDYVPLAFFSGAMLSLSVPVFVNLFLSLG